MQIRFYLDPESGEPHIYKHQVTEREAKDVLRPRSRTEQGAKDQELPSARLDPVVTYE